MNTARFIIAGGLAAARSATAAAMAAAGGCRAALPSAAQQGSTPEQRAAPTPFAMPHPLAQPDGGLWTPCSTRLNTVAIKRSGLFTWGDFQFARRCTVLTGLTLGSDGQHSQRCDLKSSAC